MDWPWLYASAAAEGQTQHHPLSKPFFTALIPSTTRADLNTFLENPLAFASSSTSSTSIAPGTLGAEDFGGRWCDDLELGSSHFSSLPVCFG